MDKQSQKLAKNHYIAVIGGAVSGSEAASMLAEKGHKVVIFDQNKLPYGKLEDGLPMWHAKLRDRQEEAINEKLSHPNIQFLPMVNVGKDIKFEKLLEDWGFSAVVLANGAWGDRPIGLEALEKLEGKNLIYQNPLLYWFNHKHEPNYDGPVYKIKNNTVVFGGGLASIDVVKLAMMELTIDALKKQHNIDIDIFTMEKKGVKAILDQHNLTLKDLGIEPISLVYRRAMEDMPLAQPADNTPEKIAKARQTSKNLMQKYIDKFLFKFIPQATLEDAIFENERFKGVRLRKMDLDGRKLIPTDELIDLETDLVISSIGSIPGKIDGLSYDGERLKLHEGSGYQVYGYNNVFAVGNAITGQGNIMSSKKHSKEMTSKIIDVDLENIETTDFENIDKKVEQHNKKLHDKLSKQINDLETLISSKKITQEEEKNLLKRTKDLQELKEFFSFENWVKKHKRVRLEDLLKVKH